MTTSKTATLIHDHVLRALAAFCDQPGATFQLMNLELGKGGREYTRYGYFDDWDKLATEAARLTSQKNSKAVYVNLQEIDPDCINRAENKLLDSAKAVTAGDVVRYRNFLVDLDRKGIKDISATDDEKASIQQALDELTDFLIHDLDWPDPRFKGDSGNGAHVNWMIDLPATKESQELVKRCYQALQQKCGNDIISIDASLADPNQLIKLYGTMTRKGDNTEKRPHRFSKLIATYETETVTDAQLQRLAAFYTPTTKGQPAKQRAISWQAQTPENVEAWAERHGIKLGKRESFVDGAGTGYKWKVDCLTSDEHKDGAVLILNAAGYLNYKCHHDSCSDMGIAAVLAKHLPIRTASAGATPTTADSEPDLRLSVDEVLSAIYDIVADETAAPAAARKTRIVKDLAFAIGELERADHALIVETLEAAKAGFTKTDAKEFVRGCVADAKKRHSAEQKAKAQAAKAQALEERAARDGVTIQINNRQLSEVAAEALDAIRAHNGQRPSVFVRAGALARVAQDERGLFGIQELNTGAMLHILSKVAEWESVVETEAGYKAVAVYPPYTVGVDMLSAGEWPGLPGLTGIVSAPVFSREGVLHDQPGYDNATRLYYTGGVKIGDTTPTPANIQRAKTLVFDNLLVDFPFKDDASKAHAFAYLLLPFVRDMIDGPTPPHLAESPTAGTGKTMLLIACAFPFLGHDAPTMAAAKDDDEWRKRITACLMNGDSHVIIDNVNHEIDSGALSTAYTGPVWKDRTLGVSRNVQIPIRTVWAVSANNIKMSQELARRHLWIRLDANEEKPWERTEFKHKHLIAWVRSHRNELATAALCCIRAWVEKGMPLYTARTKGSYEAWAGVMGGILETVGVPGFLENETELYERVVAKNDLLADFIKAWWDKFSNTTVSAYELFKLASYADSDADNMLAEWHNLLSDMLTSPKQRGRQTQLGNILNRLRDNVIAGYKITFAKSQKGMHFWRLEAKRVEPQTEVLPTEEGSTYPLPPVEDATSHSWVEPGRTSHPHHNNEETFFSSKVDGYSNGKEKNNVSDIATGGEVLLGSTYGASTTCKNGVEPQNGGSTYRQSLPAELWESGLTSFAEAQQVQKTLSDQWETVSGKDKETGLWFVRCPDWQRLVNA